MGGAWRRVAGKALVATCLAAAGLAGTDAYAHTCYQPERTVAAAQTCALLFPGGVPINPDNEAVKGCARTFPERYGKLVHVSPCPKSSNLRSNPDRVPPGCREAKINIDWVLFKDAGAKGTYQAYRRRGESPVDAVISAQGHDPHAQQTIRDCYGWAQAYIASKGFSAAPAARPRGPASGGSGGRAAGGQAPSPSAAPPGAVYTKYWDFHCTVTWWTTLKTGGIVPGLCEQDAACKPLLNRWRQNPRHTPYRWSEPGNTDPNGIGVNIAMFARQNALDHARQALLTKDYEPLAARVSGGGWNWILIDPRSGEYDSGERDRCTNGGLREWRIR